jgi:hypothetical protein
MSVCHQQMTELPFQEVSLTSSRTFRTQSSRLCEFCRNCTLMHCYHQEVDQIMAWCRVHRLPCSLNQRICVACTFSARTQSPWGSGKKAWLVFW